MLLMYRNRRGGIRIRQPNIELDLNVETAKRGEDSGQRTGNLSKLILYCVAPIANS